MRLHNRLVKAAFWTDTDLLRNLDRDGRMFYLGLIQLADDSGCLDDDTLAFKVHLYPADMDVDLDFIQRYRDKLVEMGKVVPYNADGKECLYLKNFHKHQSLRSPAPPGVPLPDWVEWKPGETPRSSGKYIVSEPYSHCTVTVALPNDDQPEPEPEVEPEPNKHICANEHDEIGNAPAEKPASSRVQRKASKNSEELDRLFDLFWSAYPKRRSKGQARKTWEKLNPDEQLVAKMIATIERAKKSVEWQKENGQFIPYPSSWLNAQGWEDEYTVTTEKGVGDKYANIGDARPEDFL